MIVQRPLIEQLILHRLPFGGMPLTRRIHHRAHNERRVCGACAFVCYVYFPAHPIHRGRDTRISKCPRTCHRGHPGA